MRFWHQVSLPPRSQFWEVVSLLSQGEQTRAVFRTVADCKINDTSLRSSLLVEFNPALRCQGVADAPLVPTCWGRWTGGREAWLRPASFPRVPFFKVSKRLRKPGRAAQGYRGSLVLPHAEPGVFFSREYLNPDPKVAALPLPMDAHPLRRSEAPCTGLGGFLVLASCSSICSISAVGYLVQSCLAVNFEEVQVFLSM